MVLVSQSESIDAGLVNHVDGQPTFLNADKFQGSFELIRKGSDRNVSEIQPSKLESPGSTTQIGRYIHRELSAKRTEGDDFRRNSV